MSNDRTIEKEGESTVTTNGCNGNVVLEDITVDVIGGEWPTTLRKNKHMLVSICNVSKWVVETCDQFCYLGSTISDTGGNIKEIDLVG